MELARVEGFPDHEDPSLQHCTAIYPQLSCARRKLDTATGHAQHSLGNLRDVDTTLLWIEQRLAAAHQVSVSETPAIGGPSHEA